MKKASFDTNKNLHKKNTNKKIKTVMGKRVENTFLPTGNYKKFQNV